MGQSRGDVREGDVVGVGTEDVDATAGARLYGAGSVPGLRHTSDRSRSGGMIVSPARRTTTPPRRSHSQVPENPGGRV